MLFMLQSQSGCYKWSDAFNKKYYHMEVKVYDYLFSLNISTSLEKIERISLKYGLSFFAIKAT